MHLHFPFFKHLLTVLCVSIKFIALQVEKIEFENLSELSELSELSAFSPCKSSCERRKHGHLGQLGHLGQNLILANSSDLSHDITRSNENYHIWKCLQKLKCVKVINLKL